MVVALPGTHVPDYHMPPLRGWTLPSLSSRFAQNTVPLHARRVLTDAST